MKWFDGCLWALVACSACSNSKQPELVGGETNFLTCERDQDCDDGLGCVDGRCVDESPVSVSPEAGPEQPAPPSDRSPSAASPSSTPEPANPSSDGDPGDASTDQPAVTEPMPVEPTAPTDPDPMAPRPSPGRNDPTDAGPDEPSPDAETPGPTTEPVCGDGVVQSGEGCDDGNTRDGDGCTPSCSLEAGFVCNAETGTCNRSCAALNGSECQGDDCCASLIVPGGALDYYDSQVTVPAYRLDKYEVSVARFLAYNDAVDAWAAAGNPVAGAGAHRDVPESGWRPEWRAQAEDESSITLEAEGLRLDWSGLVTRTYGDVAALVPGADQVPVNHVPWFVAFAFCIWDGGRLPLDTEWQFAAFGGDEQRMNVWGDAPTPQELFSELPPVAVAWDDDDWDWVGIAVGSHPASVGRYGQLDLTTGVMEWMRDTAGGRPNSHGVVNLTGDDVFGTAKVSRQGSWSQMPFGRPAPVEIPIGRGGDMFGFRCARDL